MLPCLKCIRQFVDSVFPSLLGFQSPFEKKLVNIERARKFEKPATEITRRAGKWAVLSGRSRVHGLWRNVAKAILFWFSYRQRQFYAHTRNCDTYTFKFLCAHSIWQYIPAFETKPRNKSTDKGISTFFSAVLNPAFISHDVVGHSKWAPMVIRLITLFLWGLIGGRI